jgi:HAD superfamily hydrolase (TIGR01509 family)
MNSKKIKYLLFDLGGVIILSKKFNFEKFDRKWGLPKGTVQKIVNLCFKKMSKNKNFNLKKYLADNFSSSLNLDKYKEVTNEMFKKEKINKSLINWVRKKRKKYIICLLTNNTLSLKRLLRKKFKIYHEFDYIFNSAEIGLVKSQKGFFKYVLKTLKATPEECLFIDNNQLNVKVAQNLGLNTFLFTTNRDFFKKISKIL